MPPLSLIEVPLRLADQLGVQTIQWRAQDASGNTAFVAIDVDVVDGTQPVIQLRGPLVQPSEAGLPYEDPGGTIQDPFEGDLSNLLASDASRTVNTMIPGTYFVTYTMTEPDAQNLRADPRTRTVVVKDTIKPVSGKGGGGGQVRGSDVCDATLTAVVVRTSQRCTCRARHFSFRVSFSPRAAP